MYVHWPMRNYKSLYPQNGHNVKGHNSIFLHPHCDIVEMCIISPVSSPPRQRSKLGFYAGDVLEAMLHAVW
jgi:hypothetical protein